jgi:hypothetical protein
VRVQAHFPRPSAPFRVLQTTRRRPTDAGSRLTLPRHLEGDPLHTLARALRGHPSRRTRKMLLTDFCNRLVDTCTCILDRAKPEACVRLRGAALRRGKPRRRARVGGRLTTLHELREAAARRFGRGCPLAFASALRLCGRRPFLGGNRSSPLGRRPRPRGVVFRAPGEHSSLWRPDCGGRAPKRASAARDRLPPHLVKGAASSDLRTPSIDECPLGPALARRTSNADPPPAAGFATGRRASDAPSPARP